MSIDAEEFLIPSFLNLNLKFFSAYKQIRKYRRRMHPIVGTILPIGAELVFAAGAVPVFPLRIVEFEAEKLMRGTRLASNILGSSLVGSGMRMLQPNAEGIVNQFLSEYTKHLRGCEMKADKLNYLQEVCFATRVSYGASLPYKDYLKLYLAWGTRCGWFSQLYQSINDSIPIVFTDIPHSNTPHAKQYMYEQLEKLIQNLENLTGNKITDENIREKIIITNEIRANYLEILDYLKKPDKMPISPYTYTQLLALLNSAFIDFLSALKFFNKNLTKLTKELRTRVPIDYTGIPKLLLVPVFSGNEPDLPQIVHNLGGYLIQADWKAYGLLDPINTQGNMVHNYGDYLIKTHISWKDNKTVCESWLRIAKELKVDGIIFNKLVGCTSITPATRLFKDRVQETDIPFIDIDFNRIGENISHLKNKLSSFMELIKKNR